MFRCLSNVFASLWAESRARSIWHLWAAPSDYSRGMMRLTGELLHDYSW